MNIGEDEQKEVIRIEPMPETTPVPEPSPQEPVKTPEPEKVPA